MAAGAVYPTGVQADQKSVVWTGVGAKWKSSNIPKPGGNKAEAPTVTGIACSDTDSCVATGSWDRPSLLVESGAKWSAQYAPEPGPSQSGDFVGGSPIGLACPTVNGCVSIGQWTDKAGQQRGFFEEQGAR